MSRELVYIDTAGNYGDARGLILLKLADIPDGEKKFEDALDEGGSLRSLLVESGIEAESVVVHSTSIIFSPGLVSQGSQSLQRHWDRK